jgi:hypothetical protein
MKKYMCGYLLLSNFYLEWHLHQLQERGIPILEVRLSVKQIMRILFHSFRIPINIEFPSQSDPLFSDNLHRIKSFIEGTCYRIDFQVLDTRLFDSLISNSLNYSTLRISSV